MKKHWYFILLAVIVLVIASVSEFEYVYPTHYPFNDRFILGSTRDEIVAEYGAFWCEEVNSKGVLCCGHYMIHDDTPELIMGTDNSLWYEVHFTDGIATKVNLRRGYIGG